MQCIYFITASLTTVGYGDISPEDDAGRLYCIFFLLFGLACVTSVATGIADRLLYRLEVFLIGEVKIEKSKTSLDADEHMTANEFYRYRKIIFSMGIVIISISVGTIFMAVTHGWSFIQAFYWSIVTSLTVGYGDVDFWHDDATLAFVTVYILISTLSVAVALGNFVEVSVEIADEIERKKLMDSLDIMDILRDSRYGYGDLSELAKPHLNKAIQTNRHSCVPSNSSLEHHELDTQGSFKHAATN